MDPECRTKETRCGRTSTLLLGTYEDENEHETKVRQQEYEEQDDKGCRQRV